MNKEFPVLEEKDYQKEFLSDWWSEKKLFRGDRQTGKSTLMLCEARRFSESDFDILFLSPSKIMSKRLKSMYREYFGENPTFNFGTYMALEKGNMRGFNKDVVILDEFQETTFETFNSEIMPMDPSFIRASACLDSMSHLSYLNDISEDGFFDSVYTKYTI